MSIFEILFSASILICAVGICILVFDRERTERGRIPLAAVDVTGNKAANKVQNSKKSQSDKLLCMLSVVFTILVIGLYLYGIFVGGK